MLIEAELLACGIIGLLIASYFALVYYNLISPNHRFIPRICRMEERACRYVIHTPDAKVLGLPNSLFGMLYYTGIIFYAIVSAMHEDEGINQLVLAVSIGTFTFSTYLVYSLLVKIKVDCILCYVSHTLNVIILLLSIYHNS